jgi:hypothetical protein
MGLPQTVQESVASWRGCREHLGMAGVSTWATVGCGGVGALGVADSVGAAGGAGGAGGVGAGAWARTLRRDPPGVGATGVGRADGAVLAALSVDVGPRGIWIRCGEAVGAGDAVDGRSGVDGRLIAGLGAGDGVASGDGVGKGAASSNCFRICSSANGVASALQPGQAMDTGIFPSMGSTSKANLVPQGHWTLMFMRAGIRGVD